MKLHSKNEYCETWIGTQRESFVVHSTNVMDSRAALSMELLKCAVEGGNCPMHPETVKVMCDLSALIHEEWRNRGWTVQSPPMDTSDDKPVGF